MILVDTTVWIDFFEGKETPFRHKLHDWIEEGNPAALTSLHLTEILQGTKNDIEFERTKRYLLNLPILPIDDLQTYIHAAKIYRICRQQGETVRKTADCLVAAVAIENDLPLFHNDRDFDKIASCTPLKIFKI
ncbi:MAG: PIN domain nuclease [Deltaproteobacteria bacterium]|nr:PIN domain nuclease [Deltaproteobacteria bacterium]